MGDDSVTGVCLLYMGGPETLEDVEPFLAALFEDRDLIRLPGGRLLQRFIARRIVSRRAPVVRERYTRIGGGSPLVRITRRQAALLEQALGSHGPFRVAVGMRYSEPRTDRALRELREAGARRLVALPLYPHHSSATTGSSFKDLDRALRGHPGLEVTRVADFHDHPLYVEALAGTVRRGLEALPGDRTDPARVVFSAHSLPRRLVERGDPYQRQVEATVRLVTRALELPGARWDLGYQSRSGPVRWLEPDVLDVVARSAGQGARRLLVVPVSFVSDHIETLHEIDIEMREHALSRGVTDFGRAPALNDDPRFIDALARITLEACRR